MLGIVIAILVAGLTAAYALLLLFFTLGALRLEKAVPARARRAELASASARARNAGPDGPERRGPEPADPDAGGEGGGTKWPSVSIVVPMRNEEENAEATLRALAAQDYAGEWEAFCVNDRSTDGTGRILRDFCAADPRFNLIEISPDAPPVPSPKKRALAAGFAAARGEILMTTDADCLARPGWLSSMASRFRPGIGIVQGPKRIRGTGTLLSRYQEHEVFGLVSIEAATFALGRPMLASAPSLAYRRSLYESVGGFQGLEDTVSGDDDMLVHKMQKVPGWRVTYNPDPEACVTTSPAPTWKSMLTQRARWASNGARYEDKGFVALLCCIYAFYWWLPVGLGLAVAGLAPAWLFWVPALVKLAANGIFLSVTSRRLGHTGILRDLVWCEILHVPVVLAAVILGHLGLYRWK